MAAGLLLKDVGVEEVIRTGVGAKSRAHLGWVRGLVTPGSGPVSGLGTASLTFIPLALHGLHPGPMCWTPQTELS